MSHEEHPGTYPCNGHRRGIMARCYGALRRSLHAERTREVIPRCMFRYDEWVHDDRSVSPAGSGSHLPGTEYVAPSPDVCRRSRDRRAGSDAVSYTHLRAHETDSNLVCRLLLEKKK